ncbi:MAG: hypothetical protein M5U25_04610 [Planctomycetota bacterium]|nr:hypothetical protein [Planctomycetota bacterium]
MDMVSRIRAWLRSNPPQWFKATFRDGTVVDVVEYGMFSISPDGSRGLTRSADGREFFFDVAQDLVNIELLSAEEGRKAE